MFQVIDRFVLRSTSGTYLCGVHVSAHSLFKVCEDEELFTCDKYHRRKNRGNYNNNDDDSEETFG
jgi:hypothetical protein